MTTKRGIKVARHGVRLLVRGETPGHGWGRVIGQRGDRRSELGWCIGQKRRLINNNIKVSVVF